MVNGKIHNSTHYLLKPGDIVEPTPRAKHIFKRLMQRRLANNNFVFLKERAPSTPPSAARRSTARGVSADFRSLLADGDAVTSSYRRLPLPRELASPASGPSAAWESDGTGARAWSMKQQEQLDDVVLGVLTGLAGDDSAFSDWLLKHRSELRVHAPPLLPNGDAPPLTLTWFPSAADGTGDSRPAQKLLTIDRVVLRGVLLGLLALRPADGRSS